MCGLITRMHHSKQTESFKQHIWNNNNNNKYYYYFFQLNNVTSVKSMHTNKRIVKETPIHKKLILNEMCYAQ